MVYTNKNVKLRWFQLMWNFISWTVGLPSKPRFSVARGSFTEKREKAPEERWACILHLHQPLGNLINNCPWFWSDPKMWNRRVHAEYFIPWWTRIIIAKGRINIQIIANFEGRAADRCPVLGAIWIYTVPLWLALSFFFSGEGKEVGREEPFLFHLLSQKKVAVTLWNHFLCPRETRDHRKPLAAFCRSAYQTTMLQ